MRLTLRTCGRSTTPCTSHCCPHSGQRHNPMCEVSTSHGCPRRPRFIASSRSARPRSDPTTAAARQGWPSLEVTARSRPDGGADHGATGTFFRVLRQQSRLLSPPDAAEPRRKVIDRAALELHHTATARES